MKIYTHIFIAVLILSICSNNAQLFSQSKWYKYPGNLEFHGGKDGCRRMLYYKVVIYENGTYRMWYPARYNNNSIRTLGYATSSDGINWKRHEGDSIQFEFPQEAGAYRHMRFDIIKTDTAYFMWYPLKVGESSITNLHFAWSTDGFKWIKHPEPVLEKGKDGDWDARGPFIPRVIFDGKQFYMWYSSFDMKRPMNLRTGLATSPDGINWVKHPANPILDKGEPGTWDDFGVTAYSVIYNGSEYELWFGGTNRVQGQIGHARSNDGIHWIKSPENPIIKNGELGERDYWEATTPGVVFHDSIYRMWYWGNNRISSYFIYATTSSSETVAWDTLEVDKPDRVIKAEVMNKMEYFNLDSLMRMLPVVEGRELIDAYTRLAFAYAMNDEKKGLQYADTALSLIEKTGLYKEKGMALYAKANCQYILGNYTEAFANQLSALKIFDSLNMLFEQGNLLRLIVAVNRHAGSYESAIKYALEGLDVFEKINDTANIDYLLYDLGNIYLEYGDTTSAIETFRRELNFVQHNPNIWRLINTYENLGRCYSGHNLDSSLFYYNRVFNISDSFNIFGLGIYYHVAKAFIAAGPEYYKKAEEYYLVPYNKYIYWDDHPDGLRVLNGLAELYLAEERYDKSYELLDVSMNELNLWLSRKKHQTYNYVEEKLEWETYLKQFLEEIYRLRYRLDTATNNKESALHNYILANQYRDSVYSEKNRVQWAMMQGQYETEKAENKINRLESENELKDLRIQNTRIYLLVLIGLVLITGLIVLLFIRQKRIKAQVIAQKLQHDLELKKVESEKLKDLDRLKSSFFANISHEFRTPLTLIMGPLEKVLSRTQDKQNHEELRIARKYSGKLQNLIDNILDISKLESGKMKLQAAETNIVILVNAYLQSFESLARQKKIELIFQCEKEEIMVFIDKEKFERILNNLLSNAFKFTDGGGRIKIKVYSLRFTVDNKITANRQQSTVNLPAGREGETGGVMISVSDTGCGIAPEHLKHIFDRFYQVEKSGDSNYKGTGIGLALTSELVKLHQGEISVESKVGEGSTFTVFLPMGKDHLKPEEIITRDTEDIRHYQPQELTELITEKSNDITHYPEQDNDKPILLIVEDNADMRAYIRDYFESGYAIIEAVDGLDGFTKSIDLIPDIIISDVMMPNMDGNEFCKKLKTDERTSHIPVILLTARASMESKIEGLETGADDFLTKPFDAVELQIRVKNLIEQRNRIRALLDRKIQQSHSSVHIDFTDSAITSMDEKFLNKVVNEIKEHYADPELNAQKFGMLIGLSVAQVNRKIKALTGQTTGDFIRTFRLNRALELVKNKSATIAEIAYDVGFNSPSYFSECFRLQFGKLPSEFN